MKKMKIIAAFAVATVLASCGKSGGMPNFGDNEFAVSTAKSESVEMQTEYPASIKGVQDVEIHPKVQGFITKINVQEGQRVSKGQVLFVLDNVTYTAAANQAKASVAAAQAQLATAKLTYENSQKLFNNKVIGDFELRSATNQYETAKASLAQAQAAYASAKQNLDFCYVASPANGVVGTLPYDVGALVSSATQLTTVSDNSKMDVYFSMTEKEILDMAKGGGVQEAIASYPAVRLKLVDGSEYAQAGRIATISGVIDQATGAAQVRATFDNAGHVLKSGGVGTIILPYVNSNAIMVPQDALSQVQDKYFIYIVGSDNKIKSTEVTINPNHNDGKRYIVESGLKAGDKYICQGITAAKDGMEIKPITPAQYDEKVRKAQELGKAQGDGKKLKEALGK